MSEDASGEACAASPSDIHEFNKFGVCTYCGKARSYKIALEKAERSCRGIISLEFKERCLMREMNKLGWTYFRYGPEEKPVDVPLTPSESKRGGFPISKPGPLYVPSGAVPSDIEWGEPPKTAVEFLGRHPEFEAVWNTLDLDRTLIPSGKNALWQDFVAAWNRRGLITNTEAELLIQARFE